MNWNKLLTVLLCFFLLQACKKEVADANSKLNGNLLLHFDNKAGNNDLTLNADTLKNALGQDFVVSKFNYYISNIQLLNKDGSTYTYPQNESYFLVKESDKTTQEIQLNNIPEGDFQAKTKAVLKLPKGEFYTRAETARGEFGVYIVSEGGTTPHRIKFRSPGFSNLSALDHMARGSKLGDLVAMMGTLDLVIPDIDR